MNQRVSRASLLVFVLSSLLACPFASPKSPEIHYGTNSKAQIRSLLLSCHLPLSHLPED